MLRVSALEASWFFFFLASLFSEKNLSGEATLSLDPQTSWVPKSIVSGTRPCEMRRSRQNGKLNGRPEHRYESNGHRQIAQ